MEVTEQQRHAVFTWFQEQMGPERAATIMELIPSAGASELATRSDLAVVRSDLGAVRTELKADIATVRAELADVRAELKTDIATVRLDLADVRAELKTDIGAVRAEVTELRAEVKDDLLQVQRSFVTWLVASQAAVIVAIGAATGFIVGTS